MENNKVFICFQNKGEVDANAFKLLGASSKENDDSKIGFFGSGTKYAMAVLIRNNVFFRIFSGAKEIKIGTKKAEMRGENFEVITVNGGATSMTTRMGKDWKTWFAIREVFSNALDEGESSIYVTNDPQGESEQTRFYIEMTDEVKEIWDNRAKYFAFFKKEIEVVGDGIKIFEPMNFENFLVYRKGILVHEEQTKHHLFDYDIQDIQINESRVVSSVFDLQYKLVVIWRNHASLDMVNRLFAMDAMSSYEMSLNWEFGFHFNQNWLTAIGDQVIIPKEYEGHFIDDMSGKCLKLPFVLCKELKEAFGSQIVVRGMDKIGGGHIVVEPTERESFILKECLDFLKVAEFPIENTIVVAITSKGTLGTVEGDTIVLSREVFDHGKKKVVAVLLEEYAHIVSGQGDRTRAFQDFLLNRYVSVLEDKTKIFL